METPYYRFKLNEIGRCYNDLLHSIGADSLYYALKANSEIPILSKLEKIGASFEIASPGELDKLLALKVDPSRIICSLPIKPVAWLKYMYLAGVRYFVFDNWDEYKKICEYAPEAKKIVRLYITDIAAETLEYGMDVFELLDTLEDSSENIDGVTFYLAHNHNIDKLMNVIDRCSEVLYKIGRGKILNIGGNYRLSEDVDPRFYSRLNEAIKRMKEVHECTIYAETGRSVVKTGGSLIAEIQCVKQKDNAVYVYIDAGVPTGISYEASSIKKLNNVSRMLENKITYRFYDITCSHRLLFEYEGHEHFRTGDIIMLENFGCYSICKASSFHCWELPKAVYEE